MVYGTNLLINILRDNVSITNGSQMYSSIEANTKIIDESTKPFMIVDTTVEPGKYQYKILLENLDQTDLELDSYCIVIKSLKNHKLYVEQKFNNLGVPAVLVKSNSYVDFNIKVRKTGYLLFHYFFGNNGIVSYDLKIDILRNGKSIFEEGAQQIMKTPLVNNNNLMGYRKHTNFGFLFVDNSNEKATYTFRLINDSHNDEYMDFYSFSVQVLPKLRYIQLAPIGTITTIKPKGIYTLKIKGSKKLSKVTFTVCTIVQNGILKYQLRDENKSLTDGFRPLRSFVTKYEITKFDQHNRLVQIMGKSDYYYVDILNDTDDDMIVDFATFIVESC
ncbi:MAG: hypothetical protein QW478_00655 [Candidatus Micrarchaeaceae archaeon]